MTDKTMVADTLAGINGELVRYGEMIPSDRQSKKLLCSGSLRQTGRSGSRTVSTDTALCAVKVYRTAGS